MFSIGFLFFNWKVYIKTSELYFFFSISLQEHGKKIKKIIYPNYRYESFQQQHRKLWLHEKSPIPCWDPVVY